jgi:SAM-dependent methyltransferase
MPDPHDDVRHRRIYAAAALYDRAFGYRDFAAETDFLMSLCARHRGAPPETVLELAAGPANHAMALAERGVRAGALDIEPAMRRYALEKAAAAEIPLDYRLGDMTAFAWDEPVDLVLLMLGSAGCLATIEAAVACFACVAAALAPGGLMVVELPHPRDIFTPPAPGSESWEAADGGTRLRVRWGGPGDGFDPVTQLADVSVTVTEWQDGRRRVLRDRARQRRFTTGEIALLARGAGLDLAARYGGMDMTVALEDGAGVAWRLVAVLRKPWAGAGEAP